jgi:trigger factor
MDRPAGMELVMERLSGSRWRLEVEVEAAPSVDAATAVDEARTRLVEAVRETGLRVFGSPTVHMGQPGDDGRRRLALVADVHPAIALPDLGSVVVEARPIAVADDELTERIEEIRAHQAHIGPVERPARAGDRVEMDLRATIDGRDIERGQVSGVIHRVGSGHRLEGLDETLVGMAAGQTATITTTLVGGPLGGQPATLEITVRRVEEVVLPDWDIDLASRLGHASVEDLTHHTRASLELARMSQRLVTARDAALRRIAAAADVCPPEDLVREQREQHMRSLEGELRSHDLTLADYLAAQEMTEEELAATVTAAITERLGHLMVLEALADAEGIEADDDEVDRWIAHRANRAGTNPLRYAQWLSETGAVGAFLDDVRRGGALAVLMRQIHLVDDDGRRLDIQDLHA